MKRLTFIALAALILFACGGSNHNDYGVESNLHIADYDLPIAHEKISSESEDYKTPFGQQKLIKTAHLGIEVSNYNIARSQIDSLARVYKAWISSENHYNFDYSITNNLSIRVPSSNLDELITCLIKISKKVDFQRIETSDITEEFIDIESRLKNQKLVEQKFINLLRRTDSIDDILKIESKLADIRGQIESIEGRLLFLQNRINYSTIRLDVHQKIDFKFVSLPMESFWERFKNSTDKGWKGFVVFVLIIIGLWPFWLIGAAILFALWLNKRKSKRSSISNKKAKILKAKTKAKEKKSGKSHSDQQDS